MQLEGASKATSKMTRAWVLSRYLHTYINEDKLLKNSPQPAEMVKMIADLTGTPLKKDDYDGAAKALSGWMMEHKDAR